MNPTKAEQQHKILYWFCLGGGVFFLILIGILNYYQILPTKLLPQCFLRRYTGFYCPGCGGTRAFTHLIQGRFLQSTLDNPVVVYFFLLYLWYVISYTIEYGSKGKFRIGMKLSMKYLYVGLGIILAQWLLKNILLLL